MEFGQEESSVCWRDGCQGVIAEHEVENCSCHINPPCGACTTPREYCPECGWEAKDEGEHLNEFIQVKHTPYKWEPRPLDPRKLDYRSGAHRGSDGLASTCSMVKEGVYPDGMTQEQVRAEVTGTFGGRFNHFGGGKFKYIAYTD